MMNLYLTLMNYYREEKKIWTLYKLIRLIQSIEQKKHKINIIQISVLLMKN